VTTDTVEKQDPTGKVLKIYAAAWMAVYMDIDQVRHNTAVVGRSGLSRQWDVRVDRPDGLVIGETKDHQRKKPEVRFVDEFVARCRTSMPSRVCCSRPSGSRPAPRNAQR
jgi:hypothetical protein